MTLKTLNYMLPRSLPSDLFVTLVERNRQVELYIDQLIPPVKGPEGRIAEAMRYATLGGGKRLRGFLVTEVAALFGSDSNAALRTAASVEILHAYSLVHDDLPAMDNDEIRRGLPSTHRKFGEATAILCGDALQTRAFEILAEPDTHPNADVRISLILALAKAVGLRGMVGGQMIDMLGEERCLSLDEVRHLHALKTGCLIQYSVEAGAILGEASPEQQSLLIAYGRDLGTAFQIADDILDATSTPEDLGKTAGKDIAAGKSTYVSLLGIDGATQAAQHVAQCAINHLSSFNSEADLLRALALFVIERKN